MDLTDLEPFGSRLWAPDLDGFGPEDFRALRGQLADRGVLVIAGAEVDDEAFLRFLSGFGPLTFTRGETPVATRPELNLVSNVGRSTPPRSVFHVDTTYLRRPPAYTALRAVTVPSAGGATLFTDQYRAFDTLDPALVEHLAGRTVHHGVSGLHLGDDEEREAEHPVFLSHPLSGRTALYLSTPERCTAVSGLSSAEARATIAHLYEHSIRPEATLRHDWSPHDVVIWDNRCVMHRADHAEVVGDRVLHRGVVAEA
ncbi:TauD/TfdA family dioxygenase [soil metagenome]